MFGIHIHSLDFALIIYVTKIKKFHISQFLTWNRIDIAVRDPKSSLYNKDHIRRMGH